MVHRRLAIFRSDKLPRIFALLSAIVMVCALPASAQQSVGLVLSGGGAKGIAHIGVIKALEEHNIPIDYIAGTSMGAIVGGLYAAGYTPEEMMDLLESTGFRYWSTGKIDPKWTYFYARETPTPRLATIDLNPADSLPINTIIPTSLINPLPMNFAFMDLFAKFTAQCNGNFDNLFVPFRCVTSDVYHKHKIICRGGSLGNAIRASMSFPIVFEPIEMDGVFVYDGGIYDNFPVDVMREDFAPDIMIGIDVSSPNKKPNTNNLMQQIEDMIIQNNDYSMPPEEGIKIHVPVQQYGLLDFPACREIYKIGYETAMSMIDSIQKRIDVRMPAEARQLRRAVFKSQTPYVEFDSVSVSGGTNAQNAYIKYLFTRGRRDTFGLDYARDAYYRAITPGKLRNLLPQAIWNDSSRTFKLDLNADVKNNLNVGLGGYISSSTNSMLFMSTGYNTLSFNSLSASLNGWIGQNYMASLIDMKMTLRSSIPSYFKIQGIISREKSYDSDRVFYDEGNTLITRTELFARARYGMAMGRNGKFNFDTGIGRLSSRFFDGLRVGAAERDRATYVLGQLNASFEYNTLNDTRYATAGSMFLTSASAIYGNYCFFPFNNDEMRQDYRGVRWMQFKLNYERFWDLSPHLAMGVETNTEISTRRILDNYAATMVMLPAFHPTVATYNSFNSALRAPQYTTIGTVPIWKIDNMLQLRGEFHLFMPWRKVEPDLPGVRTIDTVVKARYGRWFADPVYFGEVSAIYTLPFAHITAYANYSNTPGARWNLGLSFGLFFLAPTFL